MKKCKSYLSRNHLLPLIVATGFDEKQRTVHLFVPFHDRNQDLKSGVSKDLLLDQSYLVGKEGVGVE